MDIVNIALLQFRKILFGLLQFRKIPFGLLQFRKILFGLLQFRKILFGLLQFRNKISLQKNIYILYKCLPLKANQHTKKKSKKN